MMKLIELSILLLIILKFMHRPLKQTCWARLLNPISYLKGKGVLVAVVGSVGYAAGKGPFQRV